MVQLTPEQIQRGKAEGQDRRRVAKEVREARERLTSSSGTRLAFDLELARSYAQNRLSASMAMSGLLIAIAAASMIWVPPRVTVIWLVGVLSSHALLLSFAKRFMASSGIERMRSWRSRFVLLETVNGFAAAAVVFCFAHVEADAARVFVLFVMLVVIAASVMLTATLPFATFAATVPITFAVSAVYGLKGEITSSTIAFIAPVAELYFLFLGQRLYHNAIQTLEFRAEKDALIGELEQAKANSDEARRRAEEANLAKSRFLATMSHELRTPLNAVLGFSEVMKSEVLGPMANPTYKEYASDIHASGQHLLNLINEILDLSRIEAGRYELNEEALNLAHVVEDCHHLLKLRAKNRGITIREAYEPDLPPIWADERAVRQVVLNLLSNAIKFTPQSGEITLKVGWTQSGGEYLSVKDTGPGIPENEIPTVLSSFGQGTLALKTAEQGAGLGLPIVKGLIDLHGGTFTLKSRLREGTEVLVTFPQSRVMSALPPVVDAQPAPPVERQRLRRAG